MCSGRQRFTRPRAQRGTSLLEALAATGLLAIGVLAFTTYTVSLTRAMKSGDSYRDQSLVDPAG